MRGTAAGFALALVASGAVAGDVVELNWDYDTKPAHFREKSDFRYLANLGWEIQ